MSLSEVNSMEEMKPMSETPMYSEESLQEPVSIQSLLALPQDKASIEPPKSEPEILGFSAKLRDGTVVTYEAGKLLAFKWSVEERVLTYSIAEESETVGSYYHPFENILTFKVLRK